MIEKRGNRTPTNEIPVALSYRRNLYSIRRLLLAFLTGLLCLVYYRVAIMDQIYKHGRKDNSRISHLLKESPLVDTHIDLPELMRYLYKNRVYSSNVSLDMPGFPFHVDIPRLKAGQVGGVFWSVFTECPLGENSTYNRTEPSKSYEQVRTTLQQIDVAKRVVSKYSDTFQLVTSVKEFRYAFKAGKIASMLGAEGLHQIGDSISALRQYYDLGVRYMTLTHMCNNRYADSCSVEPEHNGLSSQGIKVIAEMNRLGMMVDLSHVSDATMRQALNVSKAPAIFSHSGAFTVNPHPRNVKDDVLLQLKRNRGIINIDFLPEYVSKIASQANVSAVVDHITHVIELIGWDHVGIGSDFDGMFTVPKGLEDVSKYPVLVAELLHRTKASNKQLAKFIGGNMLRVWSEVEDVSKRRHFRKLSPYEVDEL